MIVTGVYSQFRLWQEEGIGASIYANEKRKVSELIESLRPGLVVQIEGKPLLERVPEEIIYYHISEEPDITASGYTVEAEQGFLPFPDQSVDLLLLSHAIELYQHPKTILVECERVLANDGVIFIMVLTSSWLEGGIPREFHPLGDLKIVSVSARKVKEWVGHLDLTIVKENSFVEEQSLLLGSRLSEMVIHPVGYEIRRLEIGWNDMVGVIE